MWFLYSLVRMVKVALLAAITLVFFRALFFPNVLDMFVLMFLFFVLFVMFISRP